MAPPLKQPNSSFASYANEEKMETESEGEFGARQSRIGATAQRSSGDDERGSVENDTQRHHEDNRNQEMNNEQMHRAEPIEEERKEEEEAAAGGAHARNVGVMDDFEDLSVDSSLDDVPIAELSRARASRVTDSDQSFEDGKKRSASKDSTMLSDYAKMPAKEKENDFDDESAMEDRKMPPKEADRSFSHEESDSVDSSMDECRLSLKDSKRPTKKQQIRELPQDIEIAAADAIENNLEQDMDLSSQVGRNDRNHESGTKTSPASHESDSEESESEDEDDFIRPANVRVANDGTFIAARGGRRPKGMVWDKYIGEYVPRNKRTKDAKEASSQKGPPKKRAKANKALTSSQSAKDDERRARQRRKQDTKIGTRVYARWPGDGQYYWGVVTAIKRKPNSHFDQYSIRFHDDDFLEFVSLNDFYSLDEYHANRYLQSVCTAPPPLKKKHADEINKLLQRIATTNSSSKVSKAKGSTTSLGVEELFTRRCKECPNCLKDDCGSCGSCVSNDESNGPTKVCLQKMCCEIPVDQRAQPMPESANFPGGYTFVIDPQYEPPSWKKCLSPVKGLKIFHPGGKISFFSAENAIRHDKFNGGVPEEFYKFIGASSSKRLVTENKKSHGGGNGARSSSLQGDSFKNQAARKLIDSPTQALLTQKKVAAQVSRLNDSDQSVGNDRPFSLSDRKPASLQDLSSSNLSGGDERIARELMEAHSPESAKTRSQDESQDDSDEEEEEFTGYQSSPYSEQRKQREKDEHKDSTCSGEEAAEDGVLTATDDDCHEDDAERRSGNRTKDGNFRPAKPPKKRDDGTFAKPPGRVPAGMKWDEIRGLYAPKPESTRKTGEKKGQSSSKGKGGHGHHTEHHSNKVVGKKTKDRDKEPHEVAEASKQTKTDLYLADLESRKTRDGAILPHSTYANSLRRLEDGTLARPPGRCPAGTEWDPWRGFYVPKSSAKGSRVSGKQRKAEVSSSSTHRVTTGKRARNDGELKPAKRGESDTEDSRPEERTNKRQKKSKKGSLKFSAAAEASRPPRRALKLTSSTSTSQGLEIGSRVYAEYYNGEWYWATIVGVTRESDRNQYSLYFDDGDEMPYTSRDKLQTAQEMLKLDMRPGPMPQAAVDKLNELAKASKANPTTASLASKEQSLSGPLSLRELYERRCKTCEQCVKPDCGACVSCVRNSSSFGREREVCVRKMCLQIPDSKKMQPAVGLPPGYTFLFKEDLPRLTSYPHTPGLYIYHLEGRKMFRSTEAALKSLYGYAKRNPNAKQVFNRHIGEEVDPSSTSSSLSLEAGEKSNDSLSRDCVVGSRVYCVMEDKWGIIEKKFKLGSNKFRCSVRLEEGGVIRDVAGDKIFSEFLFLSKTGRTPPPPQRPDSDEESCEPGSHGQIDVSTNKDEVRVVNDNFLVGRALCFVWTDVKGQPKTVFGKVTECEYNPYSNEVISCNVVYTRESRNTANAVKNGCGSTIIPSQLLDPKLVVGAGMCFEEMMPASARVVHDRLVDFIDRPFGWHWLLPNQRNEAVVKNASGNMPRLTLSFRSYRLVLSVKPSTVINGGLGVFLSCFAAFLDGDCDDSDDSDNEEYAPFELEAGELLDLGVYAPLRIQDRKPSAAFYVKNFIHSFKCEEWSFDTKDSQDSSLDITDNVTGNLHDVAKKSVLPHVNETDDIATVCITPQHDPEGSVHLLLGHANESQGNFVVPCDGRAREVFMSYGDGYEKVRVRKGYSFLPDEPLDVVTDGDVLGAMNEFGAAEVKKAVDYLFLVFSKHEAFEFAGNVLERALLCAAVLLRRSQELLVQERCRLNSQMQPTPVNLGRVQKVSECVVGLLLDMVNVGDELKELHVNGDADALLKEVIKRQSYSAEDLDKMGALVE